MEFKIIEIQAKHKIKLDEKINKLNVKAIKAGLPKYSIVYKEPYEKNNSIYLEASIMGTHKIVIGNYEFVCSMTHLEEGEVLLFSSSDIKVPEEYKKSKSECEHCQINRYRKKTYLLFDNKLNKYIQVGSTCIKDFLSGEGLENIEQIHDIVADLNTFISNIDKIDTKDVYSINKFLAYSSAMVRDYGWQSKSSLETPTYIRVLNALENNEDVIITELDVEQVNSCINWVSSLSDENNYLHNLKVIVNHGIIEHKTAPLAASIIKAFQSSKPKQNKIESNYVGNVGDKIVLDLEFKKQFEFFSQYGTTYIYLFNDDNGNTLTWKTSKLVPFEDNKKYIIRGTVKKHNLYKEKYKQTELTRCKVDNIY